MKTTSSFGSSLHIPTKESEIQGRNVDRLHISRVRPQAQLKQPNRVGFRALSLHNKIINATEGHYVEDLFHFCSPKAPLKMKSIQRETYWITNAKFHRTWPIIRRGHATHVFNLKILWPQISHKEPSGSCI